jgi:hypothetical protein
MKGLSVLRIFLCFLVQAEGFVSVGGIQHRKPVLSMQCPSKNHATSVLKATRRELSQQLATGVFIAFLPAAAAVASGGATAGGPYLLSVCRMSHVVIVICRVLLASLSSLNTTKPHIGKAAVQRSCTEGGCRVHCHSVSSREGGYRLSAGVLYNRRHWRLERL